MKSIITLAVIALSLPAMVGCRSLSYKCTTQTGEIIEAESHEWLWTKKITGFRYDHKNGTLAVDSLESSPDKESIAKLCDTVTTLVGAIAK